MRTRRSSRRSRCRSRRTLTEDEVDRVVVGPRAVRLTWRRARIRGSTTSIRATARTPSELEGDEREVVVSTVARYRRPERLRVGDELPDVAAARLDDDARVELRDLVREQPLLLVFGSFT